MKIGILTFHRPINYGAFLQSFGLSNQLKRDYPNAKVEIIDYIAPKERKKIYRTVLSRLKRNGVFGAFTELRKIHVFKQSIRNLPLSKNYMSDDNLENLYKYIDNNYDLLIIGSDAIFNWNQNGYPTAFIPQYSFSIPVMTYAASVHGLAYYKEPSDRIKKCGLAFGQMKSVFVRDECSKKFVEYCNPGIKVKHVCDPTFLLDFQQLYTIQHRLMDQLRKRYNLSGRYLVLMLQEDSISKEIYEKYNSDFMIVTLFRNSRYADCFLYDLTPIEWCLVLKNAEATITSYFHGALLSLQQATPAMVVDVSKYDGVYEGKLNDLMVRRLDLPEMYYQSSDWKSNREIFFNILDNALLGKYQERMHQGVEREKKTYQNFIDTISTVIGGIDEQI